MKKLILCLLIMSFQLALAKGPKVKKVEAPVKKTEAVVQKEEGLVLKAQANKGEVVFEAVGKPSFLKIKGQGEGPEGKVQIAQTITGEFKFKLTTLNTGIEMRDTHMKDKYLQVGQHPEASLKLQELANWSVDKGDATGVSFKGSLTMHGVEKPIAGTVDIKKKGTGYEITANFETKITDYAIDIPTYAGITVADNVKVTVKSELL